MAPTNTPTTIKNTIDTSVEVKPTIRIRDLCMTYGNGHQALQSVSLCLSHSTICALVGVNGSGKSTLFNSIMGQISPQKGVIQLSEQPVKKALKQNLVAYVPQSENIDWNFPVLVKDVVMQGRFGHMGFLRIESEQDKLKVKHAMEKLEITHLANRQIGELSGGQKKRVFLARAIAQQSKIILLDEPFTGVDVTTENAIMELMRNLREEGYLMLVATHNLGTVPDYCNEVILLNQSVIAAGNTELVFTQKNLEKTFGGVLKSTRLGGSTLHEDSDERGITILTDDERPVVFYGKTETDSPLPNQK